MQAPVKQVVLTNTKNKIRLNAMFTEGILDPGYFTEATQMHTFIIAGVRDVPIEILTSDIQAPAKYVVLTNTKNKTRLNAMFTEGILDPGYFTEATQMHTFTIAGVRDVPVEITGGLRIDRHVQLVHY